MATVLKFPIPRLQEMSPEGLWLSFVSAKATISCLDARARQDGRDLTDAEDADWSHAERLAEEVSEEFKRRLQAVLGSTVKLDDLIMRGAI
jgi:hypothetical protein